MPGLIEHIDDAIAQKKGRDVLFIGPNLELLDDLAWIDAYEASPDWVELAECKDYLCMAGQQEHWLVPLWLINPATKYRTAL